MIAAFINLPLVLSIITMLVLIVMLWASELNLKITFGVASVIAVLVLLSLILVDGETFPSLRFRIYSANLNKPIVEYDSDYTEKNFGPAKKESSFTKRYETLTKIDHIDLKMVGVPEQLWPRIVKYVNILPIRAGECSLNIPLRQFYTLKREQLTQIKKTQYLNKKEQDGKYYKII